MGRRSFVRANDHTRLGSWVYSSHVHHSALLEDKMKRVIHVRSWASRDDGITLSSYDTKAELRSRTMQFRCCVEPDWSKEDSYYHKKLKGQRHDLVGVAGYTPETSRFWFGFRCYQARREE